MKRDPIILDDLQRECLIHHTEQKKLGKGYAVRLKAGVQSFEIWVDPESKAHAEWWCAMLAKALARIVRERTPIADDTPDVTEIAPMLINLRKQQKLTQKALAEKVDMKQQQIQRYEKTLYKSASLRTLVKVAVALGIRKES